MDIAIPVLELVNNLWGLASRSLGYIHNLKDNVRSLEEAYEDLMAVSLAVKAKVDSEEEGQVVKRTKQVEDWLDKVEKFGGEVEEVLRKARERDQIKCLSRCLPWNCRSNYRSGKTVDQKINEASKLQTKETKFVALTLPLPIPPVEEMPMDKTEGLDVSLKKVWKWLVDENDVEVIGLYGTGGVGKTTLMKRINQELSQSNHEFDIVIWVSKDVNVDKNQDGIWVSKEVNEDMIQDAIRKRLRIRDEIWDKWDPKNRAHNVYIALKGKKFVLLIDDVWQSLALSSIGVSLHGLKNGSKVVFTTRLKNVCDHMGANETLEVECLTRDDALKLFKEKVGKSFVGCCQEIQELAKDIVEECKGLPLALTTVGRALATKDDPGAWTHALTTLRNNPHELAGMEDVYRKLEFSYNSLDNPTLQACFLYCCLFPEGYLISPDKLIELWIGAGLLGDTDDVYSMRNKGKFLLGDLKSACLLESVGDDIDKGKYVKMHDVIRNMATWIACDHGRRENNLLMIDKREDMSAEMISKWGEAEKVSIWGELIDKTPPQCSKLETLFIRKTHVTVMPRGFFHSMVAHLTFLDLSENSNIESFPEEICDLINLRYLNLSGTSIRELPREIKNLTRLRWLLLDEMAQDILIPTGAITSLPLNVFIRWNSNPLVERPCLVNNEEIVEKLECMQHLTDLSITVYEPSSALKIFQSSNIRKCIRRAWVNDGQNDLTSILIGGGDHFSHLEVLYLTSCYVLREMEIPQGIGRAPISSCFPNLIEVLVFRCKLPNLSWLVHAPKLRKLRVYECNSMEKIVGDGFTREDLAASGLFSCLEYLVLSRLPKLTSICDHTLPFPHEVSFKITGCPGLRSSWWTRTTPGGASSLRSMGTMTGASLST